MQFVHVALDRIDDNPLQPRTSYPEDGIADLARSILDNKDAAPDTAGLIHVPLARVVDQAGALVVAGNLDDENCRVQLAVGHRRLRAFRLLAERGDLDYARETGIYELFPVILADLSDEDMATTSWRENEDRTDLSPMDEARAFRLMSEILGWKQSEIAKSLGLTRSTVSNKLRLLKFPRWVQDLVHAGALPEKNAREGLPLLEIPGTLKREIFLLSAGTVRPSRDIADGVRDAIERKTSDLTKASWTPLDMWTPTHDDSYPIKLNGTTVLLDRDVRACANCPERRKIAGRERCFDQLCYAAKIAGYKAEVTGPEKAKQLHGGFSAWKRNEIGVPTYSTCSACGLKADEAPTNAGWYSPTSQQWIHICPWCWERAGLPDPSAPAAEPAGTVVVGSPDGEPTTVPQVSRDRAAPSAPQAPQAPAKPPMSLERVEIPTERKQIITIRIEAGIDDDRPFTASMGDEIAPGRVSLETLQMRSGPLDQIGTIVTDLVAAYNTEPVAV
jgi:ParB/RepB/Spo0J family partition protein